MGGGGERQRRETDAYHQRAHARDAAAVDVLTQGEHLVHSRQQPVPAQGEERRVGRVRHGDVVERAGQRPHALDFKDIGRVRQRVRD